MVDAFRNQMSRWRHADWTLTLNGSAALRMAVPLLLAATVITALVLMLLWREQSSFKPVFGAKENITASDVIAVLDAESIGYRLHPDSGQVLVAEDDLARARLLLAGKGVVAKLPEGLELMDRDDPLGVSQFVQDVRFRRGLEGELAKSITSLETVESARVHLSIARSSSFVVNTGEKSSAAVVLTLKQGRQLGQEQIAAIINLVAGSVAGLDPKRVTLTDQAGNFLSARLDLGEGFEGGGGSEAERRFSEEARRNTQELLAPILGEGNFRLSVTAEIDNDRVEETREQYTGDPRILSEATREEKDGGLPPVGVPGSLSNRPPAAPAGAASAVEAPSNLRAAVSRNYTHDRSITQIKRSKGRLRKLNVAVVLNDGVAPGGAGRWPEAEVARIEKLLRSGLGIDTQRGDQLTVTTLAFSSRAAMPASPWWQQPQNILDMVVVGLWTAGGLVVLLLLRSALRVWARRSADKGDNGEQALDMQSMQQQGAPAPMLAGSPGGALAGGVPMVPLLENVDLPPAGSAVDVMVEHLRTLAAKEPGRVAEVVKQWVQKHGQPDGSGR